MAILNRLQAYGDASQADNIEGYLRDFDPAIAQKAAEILTAWTGKPRTAAPQPLTPPGRDLGDGDGAARQGVALSHGGRRPFRRRPGSGCRAADRDPHRASCRRGLLQRPDVPSHRAELRHPGRQSGRQRIQRRTALHARRGRPALSRHGRHFDARPRHRRRADLRQPDRLAAPRSHLHRVRHRDRRHGCRRQHSRRRRDRTGRAGRIAE